MTVATATTSVDQSSSVLPFLGGALLVTLLLLLTAYLLWRRGSVTVPRFGRTPAPEDEAKRILAERFATGDISTEEFLERSSILNWTPGSDNPPPRQLRR